MRALVLVSIPFVFLASCADRAPNVGTDATTTAASTAGAPTGLVYASSRSIYNAGRAIAPNTATVNGAGITFSVAPPLPAGLALDASSGTISGTPLATQPTTRFVVTAVNPSGSARFALWITVLEFGFTIEPHQRGQADTMRFLGASFGRLVDVWSRETSGAEVLRVANAIVDESIVGSDPQYALATNIGTGAERLVIQAPFGTSAFADAYDSARAGLIGLADRAASDLPPFSAVPRNAALSLKFDDLVDPATIGAETIALLVGLDLAQSFTARVFADPTYGGAADADHDGLLETYPTRILVDLTVSEAEAEASNPPLAVNWLGLPAATTTGAPNAILRMPTRTDAAVGQLTIVRNLAGNAIAPAGSGSNDPASATADVVRAFRSGGVTEVTGDVSNGALIDVTRPNIVGTRAITLSNVIADPSIGTGGVRADVTFASSVCATSLDVGDTLRRSGLMAEVVELTSPPIAQTIAGVRARLVTPGTLTNGPADVLSRFSPILHGSGLTPACFLSFSEPTPPASPFSNVSPTARIGVRFDEALDPASVRVSENVQIATVANANSGISIVPCNVRVTSDARKVELVPVLPLRHASGSGEQYFFDVKVAMGVTDTAGNLLASSLDDARFTLNPSAAAQLSRGMVFRFDSSDDLFNDGLPELKGTVLFDTASSRLRPRQVARFSATADRTQPVPSLMSPFAGGVQTPLSSLGSKLQAMWRYCDVGLSLLDESSYDVDVEGLAWAPAGGSVIADHYARFEIGLSHALRLADESVDSGTLLPLFPNSGVVMVYASNVLDPILDPLRTVHPGAHGTPGYTISPIDLFISGTGTPLLPFPLNRGVPAAQREYFTWRNTALRARGGANGPGVELPIVSTATGTPPATYYAGGSVPTIGLPLLMEFRCYPDASALGLNAFDVSLATSSSSRPAFRAFSTGGIDTSGTTVVVQPDFQNVATGGFDPQSIPPGQSTPPLDNTFYLGGMELVTRISRARTVWLATGVPPATFAAPVVSPAAVYQPAGTSIVLAFRGATSVDNPALRNDVNAIDPYGDRAPGVGGPDPVFTGGVADWSPHLSSLNGSRFFQVRVTFVSNAATHEGPALDSLGFAWRE